MQAASKSTRGARADDTSDGEWPWIARTITSAVALPVILVELLDIACNLAIHSGGSRLQGFVIDGSDYALLPGYAFIAYRLARRGVQGAYLSALGVFVSLVVVFNFRGAYLRFGTFDRYDLSAWAWMRYVLIGSFVGAAAGLSLSRPPRPLGGTTRYFALPVVLVAVGLASHLFGFDGRTSSMWAPSRFYALVAIGLLLAALLAVSAFSKEDLDAA